jgi:hypothetical protein
MLNPRSMRTLSNEAEVNNERHFDRVLVVGDSYLSSRHVRAWKLAGVVAERVSSPKEDLVNLNPRTCLDVCVSNFEEKVHLIESSIRSGNRVITTEPVSNKYETTKRILKRGAFILDPMSHHPLLTKAVNLITERKIGPPRILRIGAMSYDKKLSGFSLLGGLVHGVSAANLLLNKAIAKKVFATKIKTDYSNMYAALLNFDNGSTCQLLAGNSAMQGGLEFSINGPAGMIAFNEAKTLDSPSGTEQSNGMDAITSIEVLYRMFLDFMNHIPDSRSLTKYQIVNAIVDSARQKKQISLR